MTPRLFPVSLLIGLLAGCATTPPPDVRRDARLDPQVGAAGATQTTAEQRADGNASAKPTPVIRRGSGTMINQSAAAAPSPTLGMASSGSATFNFEGESVQAVVKAILGDMLGQNYVIAPGVQGTVTLATPNPVSPAQALNLLEMVLGWNNARMVFSGGRYNIVPADQALAGTVAPSTASPSAARGFEVRVVPLKYISASEMKKVLEPYARPNAIVGTDASRNVITLGGTRAEPGKLPAHRADLRCGLVVGHVGGRVPDPVRQGRKGQRRSGKGLRRTEQDPQCRHVPFHAAGKRQRGAGDHPAAALSGPDPAVAGPHRQRRWRRAPVFV